MIKKVSKGDKATNRFHNLRVEEVSLVDAAANEEEFLVIKRRNDMAKDEAAVQKSEDTAEVTPTPVDVEKSEITTEPEVTTPEVEEVSQPDIAAQVAQGVAAGMKAFFETQPQTVAQSTSTVEKSEPKTETVEKSEPKTETVEKSDSSKILEAISGINSRLDAQDEKIEKAANVRATAKGANIPESTVVAKSDETETQKSKWAGTAVHSVANRGRR